MIWLILFGVWLVVWYLFVEGYLWRSILFFAGWFGIRYFFLTYYPATYDVAITFGGCHMSWAAAIASAVCVMALLTTKDN